MSRRITSAVAVAATLAVAAPAAAAPAIDGRHAALTRSSQDLRSPDARDAATPAGTSQDLRSPDARDAALPVTEYAPLQRGRHADDTSVPTAVWVSLFGLGALLLGAASGRGLRPVTVRRHARPV